MKLGFSWLKGSKAIEGIKGLQEQVQGLLPILESLKGGILPDHVVESVGQKVRGNIEMIEGMVESLPEGEVQHRAKDILNQVLSLTAPSPQTGEPIPMKEVLSGQSPVQMPEWLHSLNELASGPSGSPALNQLIDYLKKLV